MTDPTTTVGRADAALDGRLNDELDELNAAANLTSTQRRNSPFGSKKTASLSRASPAGRGGMPQESP